VWINTLFQRFEKGLIKEKKVCLILFINLLFFFFSLHSLRHTENNDLLSSSSSARLISRWHEQVRMCFFIRLACVFF
jgi:hypothetical protein